MNFKILGLLLGLLAIGIVAFIIYWFFIREKSESSSSTPAAIQGAPGSPEDPSQKSASAGGKVTAKKPKSTENPIAAAGSGQS